MYVRNYAARVIFAERDFLLHAWEPLRIVNSRVACDPALTAPALRISHCIGSVERVLLELDGSAHLSSKLACLGEHDSTILEHPEREGFAVSRI